MVQKEIEQTYEEVVTETETEEVTFCDGCTEETNDYVTLSNISVNCLEQAAGSSHQVQRLMNNAEEFHICAGCQKGLREHGRTIDTALYEPPEEDDDGDSVSQKKKNRARVMMLGFAFFAIVLGIAGVLVAVASNPVGGVGMLVIAVVMLAATFFDPSNTVDRSN